MDPQPENTTKSRFSGAFFLSIFVHGALVFFIGKCTLDQTLPEGQVTSLDIDYTGSPPNRSGAPIENQPTNKSPVTKSESMELAKPEAPTKNIETSKPKPIPNIKSTKSAAAIGTESPTDLQSPVVANQSADVESDPTDAKDLPMESVKEIPTENAKEETEDSNLPSVPPAVVAEEVKPTDTKETKSPEAQTVLGKSIEPSQTDSKGTPASESSANNSAANTGPPVEAPGTNVQSDAALTPLQGNKKVEYPYWSRLRSQQGTVILHYRVGIDGKVKEVRMIQSSGYPFLDNASVKTVRDWKFKPLGREGWYERPFQFQLKGDSQPGPSRLRSTN